MRLTFDDFLSLTRFRRENNSEGILQDFSCILQASFAHLHNDSANLMRNSPQNLILEDRKNVAEQRIAFGAETALALRRALIHHKSNDEQAWGLVNRLWTCSEPDNHFLGDDLHNRETGELYPGNGNLWGCGSRLCPSCVAKASNRSRKELQLSLKHQKLRTGENYQFITLTMPNPSLPWMQTRAIMARAWTLMRKREYFISRIRGGSKSEEFTVTENGYHYHIHLLCLAGFLSYEKFRSEWTECLRIAHFEIGVLCSINTSDGLAMVNIQKISSTKSLKGAVQEVCKYVTKADSWEKLSEKDLLDVASIERFPRMFELFRFFRLQRNINALLESPSVYVTYLILQLAVALLEKLNEIIENGESHTILDTKEISDGEPSEIFPKVEKLPDKIPKKERLPSWRNYISEYGLEEYLDRLAEQVGQTREVRKLFLRQKYEFAVLKTMNGISF